VQPVGMPRGPEALKAETTPVWFCAFFRVSVMDEEKEFRSAFFCGSGSTSTER